MDFLERYLQAVKFWLPRTQQKDIVAELRENISSQIEDRESELGRSLVDEEILTILRQAGHPMLVASQYAPQRQLIGPLLYPIYVFVLKMITLFYLLPWLLVWLGLVIFLPSYRAAHGVNVGEALGSLWTLTLYFSGAVTLAFAIAERLLEQKKLFAKWDPRKLPAVRPEAKRRVSRLETLAGLFAVAILLITWLNLPQIAPAILGPVAKYFAVAPGLKAYYTPVMLLILSEIALHLVMLFRPQLTWLPPATRAITTAIALAMLIAASRLTAYVTLTAAAGNDPEYVKAAGVLNQVFSWSFLWTGISLGIALIVYGVQAVSRLRKFFHAPPVMPSSQML